MELTAAIRGLEALTSRKRVRLYSDSQYLVRGMNEWLPGWIRSNRLKTPEALKNQDLWQQLAVLAARHEISWEWVRGHAGNHFNERCDRLAKRAAEEGVRTAAGLAAAGVAAEPLAELPVITERPEPLPAGEQIEYATDQDGQLLLC
jgi:ribonuclease HI